MLPELDPQLLHDLRQHANMLALGLGVGILLLGWQKTSGWWRDWRWRLAQDDQRAIRDEAFDRRWGFVADRDSDAPQDLQQVLSRFLSHSALLMGFVLIGWIISRAFGLRSSDGIFLAGIGGSLCTWYLDREYKTPGRDIVESHFVTPPTLSEQFPPEAVYGAIAAAAILGLIVLGIWLL